jgi:branched-chain amino acid aminotransferase
MVESGRRLWINGELCDSSKQTALPLLSQAQRYGGSALEGVRAYRQRLGTTALFRLHDHVARLLESCKLLRFELSVSREQLLLGCGEVIAGNGFSDADLRVLLWCPDGTASPSPGVVASVAALAWPAEELLTPRAPLHCNTVPSLPATFSRGKLSARLLQNAAVHDASRAAGYDAALLLSAQGWVTGGSDANVFMVARGEVITPPLWCSAMAGITRDTVLVLAREEGFLVREEPLLRDALYLADEVFLVSTQLELAAVGAVDHYPIADGQPGPVTRHLQQRYRAVSRGNDLSHPEWLFAVG